jgi:hypothetical protein
MDGQHLRDQHLQRGQRAGWRAEYELTELAQTATHAIGTTNSGAQICICRGLAGALPQAGMKMGAGFESGQAWPKLAVYPSSDEVAAEIGREVQDFVLLMEPDEDHGFLREWAPREIGPARHFGYALQWFAMAAVLSALLIWNHRKRRFS